MEDFSTFQRMGDRVRAVGLDRLDLGEIGQEHVIHHIAGGAHDLGDTYGHGGPPRPGRNRAPNLVPVIG